VTESGLPEGLLELARVLFAEETLAEALQRVVDPACTTVPGCAHAGLSLLTGRRVITAAATDGTTLRLDGARYDAGDGPCVHAARVAPPRTRPSTSWCLRPDVRIERL
jgi:hypothetical protein